LWSEILTAEILNRLAHMPKSPWFLLHLTNLIRSQMVCSRCPNFVLRLINHSITWKGASVSCIFSLYLHMYMIKKPAEFFFHACNIRFFFAFLLIYYFGCYANGEFNNFLEHEFVSYFLGIYFLHIEKYPKKHGS
jgi:hypothetical protein